MALDAAKPDLVLGIVGCGTMGRGIAQIAAAAGCRVLLVDSRPGAAAEAREAIGAVFPKLVERGKMTAGDADAALARLVPCAGLADLAPAEIVVEAIVEAIDAKQALMRELEAIVEPECLLATNTSSLSVTAIAAACARPGRVGGYHFFNPVPLMKVVEVIDGALTEPWVGAALTALSHRLGHKPVKAKDTPGFIVNHAGRGYGTEALRLFGEGIAEPATIDAILREAAGFRMGPFELLDLTGLDVSHPVMESLYRQYYEEPRFRPSPLAAQRMAAGLFGRKSGRGFYRYEDGQKVTPPKPDAPAALLPQSVWIGEGPHRAQIARIADKAGVPIAEHEAAELCVVPLLGEDTSTATVRLHLDAARTIGIDGIFGIDSHRTLVPSPATSADARAAALGLFTADGIAASLIGDSPGAVAQRVLANIVNVACDIAQQRIAAPADIDTAVMLGLGYPRGPLAWGDSIGTATVLRILETLQVITGDPRYRPSLWLRRRAQLHLSLLHDD